MDRRQAGMCVYCNHCQQLYEQWTIDRTGIPFLVMDPPTVADGVGHDAPRRCRYTIYKDLAAVRTRSIRAVDASEPT